MRALVSCRQNFHGVDEPRQAPCPQIDPPERANKWPASTAAATIGTILENLADDAALLAEDCCALRTTETASECGSWVVQP